MSVQIINNSYRGSEKIIFFYYFCIFALLCDAFVTYYFAIGPLFLWRQFLFVIASYLLFKERKFFREIGLQNFLKIIFICFLYYVIRSIISYLDLGYNSVRLSYAIWLVFCGVPFILLPYILLKAGYCLSSLFKFLCFLGAFYGFGLIVDGLTGGYFAYLYQSNYNLSLEELSDVGRYSFWATHVTTTGIFMCLCTLSALYLISKSSNIGIQFFYFGCALCMLGGIWFTGARQSLFPMIFNIVFGFILLLFFNIRNKILFIIILLCAFPVIIAEFIPHLLKVDNITLVERYTKKSITEDTRSLLWVRGLHEVIMDPIVFTFGHGVGYVGPKILPGESFGNHYENTYFSRISCTGIADAFLLFYPIWYILSAVFSLRRFQFLDMLLILFVGDYIFIAFVSPNGSTTTAQVALYISCGLAWSRKFYKNLELKYGSRQLQ